MTTFQPTARRLLANHYLIIPIRPGQKRPQGSAWQHARLSATDVPRVWSNGVGVGVLCGVGALPVYAVDIDVYDEVMATTLERWCERNLGVTAVRIGRPPKRLLLYQGRAAGLTKRSSANWYNSAGPVGSNGRLVGQHVEVLGSGQQFVAAGIHPDTGREYEWVDCIGGITEWEATALPVLEEAGVGGLIAEFERLALEAGWQENSGADNSPARGRQAQPGEGSPTATSGLSGGADVPDALLTPVSVGKSIDAIKATLDKIDPDLPRETWIRVIAATKHEVTTMPAAGWPEKVDLERWRVERAQAGFDAALAWSARGAKFVGVDDVRTRWQSFKRAEGVTWGWVEALASGGAVEAATGGLVAPARPKRPRTEMGNAERLLDRFGTGLMFVPDLMRWYSWTGVFWRRAMSVEIEHLAKATILALREEVDMWPEDDHEAFFKFCAASQKAAMVANMVRLASSDPRVVVPASELDKNWWCIGVRNGAIDLRSGAFLPPATERRVTLTCGCDWVAGATNALWESTVADVFSDDAEMIAFFQRLVGYTLTGRPDEDVMAIPWGSGSNGKSTLLGALATVFGEYARVCAADTFLSGAGGAPSSGHVGPRPDLLAMRGARLVWIGEPDQGAELREGFVKSATGGDPITARAMHSNDIVTIMPSWVLWMPTNHRPLVRTDDWAMWRRLMPLPFTRDFDHDPLVVKDSARDKRLADQPDALAGILNWCIAGAQMYLKDGLHRPDAVTAARDAYRQDMDLLAEWMTECCERGSDLLESGARLWGSWEAFARQRGELRLISSQRALVRRLESRGFQYLVHSVSKGIRGFRGLRVKPEQLLET